MKRILQACLPALLLVASPASATPHGGSDKASGSARPGDRKSVVKFDGDTIDGDLMRPDGDLMSVRPDLSMPNLVEAPRNFDHARRATILSGADAADEHRAQKISEARR